MATMGKMHVIQGVGKIKNLNKSCFTYSVHLFEFLLSAHTKQFLVQSKVTA